MEQATVHHHTLIVWYSLPFFVFMMPSTKQPGLGASVALWTPQSSAISAVRQQISSSEFSPEHLPLTSLVWRRLHVEVQRCAMTNVQHPFASKMMSSLLTKVVVMMVLHDTAMASTMVIVLPIDECTPS